MDLKAKAPVQYFNGDNGYYGCSFCEHKGEHNKKHYYPYQIKSKRVDRTNETVEIACQQMRNDNKLTEVIAFGLILIIFSIMG